jgi:hypothetical protein
MPDSVRGQFGRNGLHIVNQGYRAIRQGLPHHAANLAQRSEHSRVCPLPRHVPGSYARDTYLIGHGDLIPAVHLSEGSQQPGTVPF